MKKLYLPWKENMDFGAVLLLYHFQVKYLGEDGEDIPVAGAVAVCSPWDLLVISKF